MSKDNIYWVTVNNKTKRLWKPTGRNYLGDYYDMYFGTKEAAEDSIPKGSHEIAIPVKITKVKM